MTAHDHAATIEALRQRDEARELHEYTREHLGVAMEGIERLTLQLATAQDGLRMGERVCAELVKERDALAAHINLSRRVAETNAKWRDDAAERETGLLNERNALRAQLAAVTRERDEAVRLAAEGRAHSDWLTRAIDAHEKTTLLASHVATVAATERDTARAERDAAIREADRLRHGVPVEGDFVCPTELERDAMRKGLDTLRGLLYAEDAPDNVIDAIDALIGEAGE